MSNTQAVGYADKMMSLNRKARDQELSKKTAINSSIAALDTLETKLMSLQTSLLQLDHRSDFLARKTTVALTENPVLSATAGGETLSGDYVVTIIQMATKTVRTGSSDIGAQVSPIADVSGLTISAMPISVAIKDGTFTVNGLAVTVDVTDSLQDLFDAISSATGGLVTASYNATTDKIELSSASEIILGSPADTSNFLKSVKLYSNGTGSVGSTAALGAVDLSSSIESANLKTIPTSGSFKINGISFSYDVSSDSLGSIIQNVNASPASVVINYDATQDRFTITNTGEGKMNLSVQDTSGNLLEALGLSATSSLELGANAQYTVNSGPTLTSSGNAFDSTSHGIDGLYVIAKKIGTDTITVSQDSMEGRSHVNKFISQYNEIQSFIKENTKVIIHSDNSITKGPLNNNPSVSGMDRELRRKVYTAVAGMTGSIKQLENIGIDFKADSNELEVKDSSKLDEALSKDIFKVITLFTDSTDGITTRLNTYIENSIKTDSSIDKSKDNLNTNLERIDAKVKKLEDELNAQLRQMEMNADQIKRLEGEMQRNMQLMSTFYR